MVKTLVLQAAGINCDRETAYAFELAGAVAERVHVNDVIDGRRSLTEFQILALPGGFSFGDDIAGGKVLANKLAARLAEPLAGFVDQGGLVLGICNGFQAMVKLGLLPGLDGDYSTQQVSLVQNESARFEDRWVYLKPEPISPCIFTRGIERPIYLPVRHGEGRFVADAAVLSRLESGGHVSLRYSDVTGETDIKESGASHAPYPVNPNGSVNDIAGLSDATGRVFGLMPHPECFVDRLQHPRWTREQLPEAGDGLIIFKNAVEYARDNLA